MSRSHSETSSCTVELEFATKTRSSRESLKQVAADDLRKQLKLSVPLYNGKYEFKMSSITTTILNLLSAEAEQKDKTRNFQTYSGPGSDGSSADKPPLDLINPWDAAITLRPEWLSMSKTAITQYDPSESWCTEQSDVWLDDVKTFLS